MNQQHDPPGSSSGSEAVSRSRQSYEAQTAELQQLKAELAALQARVRDAGEGCCC